MKILLQNNNETNQKGKKIMPPLCFRTIDRVYCTVHFLFKMKLINDLMSLKTKANKTFKNQAKE